MKTHTIDIKDITKDKYIETTLCSSIGGSERKKLVIEVNILNLDSNYRVVINNELIYRGNRLDVAVSSYNVGDIL